MAAVDFIFTYTYSFSVNLVLILWPLPALSCGFLQQPPSCHKADWTEVAYAQGKSSYGCDQDSHMTPYLAKGYMSTSLSGVPAGGLLNAS